MEFQNPEEFQDSGLSLASTGYCSHLGSEPLDGKISLSVSPSHSLTLPSKQTEQ